MVEEERAKSSEEKFQKLKNMYTQIRDEHIKLLRQVKLIVNFSTKLQEVQNYSIDNSLTIKCIALISFISFADPILNKRQRSWLKLCFLFSSMVKCPKT